VEHDRSRSILLLTLGGTISSVRDDVGSGAVPRVGAADLAEQLAAWTPGVRVTAEEFRLLPSPSLSVDDLLALHAEISRIGRNYDGVVISQGTDTVEETGFVLDVLGTGRDLPVVITGAMRDHGLPGPDGIANLRAALDLAASGALLGVSVVMADKVFAARRVQKESTVLIDAFRAESGGLLGVISERVPHLSTVPVPAPTLAQLPTQRADLRVALLGTGIGDDLALLPVLAGIGYAGAVLEGMGGGHVAPRALENVRNARIPVVLSSRAGAGPVLRATYGYPGGEIDLLGAGLIWGGRLSGVKARLLLILLLRLGLEGAALAAEFERIASG